jgi:hypothetical protein
MVISQTSILNLESYLLAFDVINSSSSLRFHIGITAINLKTPPLCFFAYRVIAFAFAPTEILLYLQKIHIYYKKLAPVNAMTN